MGTNDSMFKVIILTGRSMKSGVVLGVNGHSFNGGRGARRKD